MLPGELPLHWFSEEEIKTNPDIKEHIRIMALEVLKVVKSEFGNWFSAARVNEILEYIVCK
ncbi:MAG: hypothetical protein QHH06_09985 [Clostridiales bacterium]|nr:hypothetical protein [Eubacteriales bacterium]MDH7566794.1 hypothetical protein [Clostridiales bacterium]